MGRSSWFLLGVLLMGFLGMVQIPESAGQDLVPVYPANGSVIRFQDLVNSGFQWTIPAENTGKFQVRISGPDPFLSQVPFVSDSSPLKLTDYFERYFTEGSVFQWRVEEVDSQSIVVQTTDTYTFTISNTTSLIPSPTPLVWPTPSGDLDGSSKIDARDLFIFASAWVKSDGSLIMGNLNGDSRIDWNDLLLYWDRFGKPAPSPTPVPLVGQPQNITFYPYQDVTISETSQLEIRWSPPSYPTAGGILYDLLIVRPDGKNIEANGLTATTYKPFSTIITLTGPYSVYLRARLDTGGLGTIVTSKFTIVINRPVQPTPTPVPQTANLSGDSSVDAKDAALFSAAYGTYEGHVLFNPLADFFSDGKIDRNDLLLFQKYYWDREESMAAPQWLQADIPVIHQPLLDKPDEYNVIHLEPPYELPLGQDDPMNALAEAMYCRLYFSPVIGAIDYFVSIHYENYDLTIEFYTGGSTEITERMIPKGYDEVISIVVRAAGTGLQLGEKSETLRVIIPPR